MRKAARKAVKRAARKVSGLSYSTRWRTGLRKVLSYRNSADTSHWMRRPQDSITGGVENRTGGSILENGMLLYLISQLRTNHGAYATSAGYALSEMIRRYIWIITKY